MLGHAVLGWWLGWERRRALAEQHRYFAADARLDTELGRLRLIEAECDPTSRRHFTRLGIGDGWRCLEVGAGGGSIARWLSERVGASGAVVAADIDPRFLDDLRLPNVEVRRLDITKDELEPDSFDVIHCRLLLMHMSDPAGVLRRMTDALRPGGWILAEEPDNEVVAAVDHTHPLAHAFTDAYRKRIQFVRDAGIMDFVLGKSLPALMKRVGLVDIGNEGTARIRQGGDGMSGIWLRTWEMLDPRLVSESVLTDNEADLTRRAYLDPSFTYREQLMVSAWGRRPA